MKKAKDLKKALEWLERLEKIADRADAEYEADPMNAEKEAAFDEAYAAEFEAHEVVIDVIVEMTDGQIDAKTAHAMIMKKRAEILSLIA